MGSWSGLEAGKLGLTYVIYNTPQRPGGYFLSMKRSYLLISLTLISSFAFSQTTTEEYNYITKGYRIQLEAGLDMKKGYFFVEKTRASVKVNDDTRKGVLKGLYRKSGDSTVLAAYMLIYQYNNEPAVYYCIPHPKSSANIINQYISDLYNGENTKTNQSYRLQLIAHVLANGLTW